MSDDAVFGRTVQLFLVDGTSSGLRIATIHGWTGTVLVSNNENFARLVGRTEASRTGVYILFGPDPAGEYAIKVYIGEGTDVSKRIAQSADKRGFWDTAVAITTSDDALTKGEVLYLEARLIELARNANRVAIDNIQGATPENKRLPEASVANMEAFLANLKVVLAVIGLEMLKEQPVSKPSALQIANSLDSASALQIPPPSRPVGVEFEIYSKKTGVRASAFEADGEFVVTEGSRAVKDAGFAGQNSYAELKLELIKRGILTADPGGRTFCFTSNCPFRSPSAAAAVVLDRSSNGRTEWKVIGSDQTYADWQRTKANAGKSLNRLFDLDDDHST